MPATIEAIGLIKQFGRVRALDGLDLTVQAGEVHGFLGPNGSGKSTTIRVLLGLLRAQGSVRVFGHDPWREADAVHAHVAYVPGDVNLWPGLTGGEIIDLLTRLRGGADPALRASLLHAFELDPRTRARAYSKGNRQKVALVAAFARRADLYIFDEPTSGLDPVMESVFREQVQRVRADGATVLLSSHILSEVEQLCERFTIVRAGVTVETGSLSDLRRLARTSIRATTNAQASEVRVIPGVHDVHSAEGTLEFTVDSAALSEALGMLTAAGVTALTAAPPSLEALFLRHYSADSSAGSSADSADNGLAGGGVP